MRLALGQFRQAWLIMPDRDSDFAVQMVQRHESSTPKLKESMRKLEKDFMEPVTLRRIDIVGSGFISHGLRNVRPDASRLS